jgi:hypothetical protein
MRELEPLGPLQIEASRDIASHDALCLILGHAEGGEDADLVLTELPREAIGKVSWRRFQR